MGLNKCIFEGLKYVIIILLRTWKQYVQVRLLNKDEKTGSDRICEEHKR